MIWGRRVDLLLAALVVIDAGGAVPMALSQADRSGWGVDVWNVAFSAILGVCAVALMWCWVAQRTHPVVEWMVRLGGVTWLAGAFALALNGDLNGYVRADLGLVAAGLALTHLVYARRIERDTAWGWAT